MGTTLLLFWMASAAAKLVQLINFDHNHAIFSFHSDQLHSSHKKKSFVLFRNLLQEQGAISQQEGVGDLHGKGGDDTFLEQCARGLSCNGLRYVALSC